MKSFFFTLLFCVMFLFCGCGPKERPTGSIKGHLTWNAKPVGMATITLQNPTLGRGASVEIDPSGSFFFKKIETGFYEVSITPTMTGQPESGGFPLPAKYRTGDKSELTFEVKEGENTLNLDLK